MRAIVRCVTLAALGAAPLVLAHGPGGNGEPPAPPFLSTSSVAASRATPAQKPGQSLPLKPTRTVKLDTDEGTWISLDVSPDGRSIVFELLGDLYAVDMSGGDARRIASGLGFDTQATFSPDGSQLAFLSDRSGAENLWVANADGSGPRQISFHDDYDTFVSPAWSADGKSVYVSHHRADLNAYALLKFDVAGNGEGQPVIPIRSSREDPKSAWRSVLGAAPSRDGRFLYYAVHFGDLDFDHVPEWNIGRRDLATGAEEVLVSAPKSPRPDLSLGSAFRPAISPDGRTLVYASRHDARTGLRVLDLETKNDRWLAFPVQQDQLQAFASQDLLPRYAFTPDGKTVIATADGKIRRIELATGESRVIPFKAHVAVKVGPPLRVHVKQETGPVRARLIQAPVQSPDGRRLAFSALGSVYVMDLTRKAKPRRLTSSATPEFQPAWSPDGRRVVYITWSAREAGHVWSARADGRGEPARLTSIPAYYTYPTYTPDGSAVLAVRSSNSVRMHAYMEYGSVRQGELVRIPPAGRGKAAIVASGVLGGRPQFTADPKHAYVSFAEGLNAVALDGSGRRRVMAVVGPSWYFAEGPAPVDDFRISPDGHWALAQIAQQLHLVAVPRGTSEEETTVDLSVPSPSHRRITDVGADFFEWADAGRTITWAVGSTFYRRPLASVHLDQPTAALARGEVAAFEAVVEVPRDVPRGAIVLRGATAITMKGDEVLPDSDVVVIDDRIAAVGRRGAVPVPKGATIRDVSGRFILPGFIDVHDHLADVRRGVLDLESWGARANLAYGVTTAFDPSPLSIDMLAYEDLVDTGQMIGSRIHSTGPALFSFNEFASKQEVLHVLSRYTRHYRTYNLKEYRTGNRRVRQWIAEAARELGVTPTTEGALSLKLDLTQIMDGFAGSEHALPAVPLYDDVVQLLAKTRTSYTLTLQITNGGPEGQDYFIAKAQPHDDAKLNRFSPHYIVDIKTLQRRWRDPREYLFPRIAASAARVQRAGGLLGIGTHGEMPGLGFHWEMQAYASGGMTPREVLRAATLDGAETIGRQAEFGSVEPGKYADLVVLDGNPLENIEHTLAISLVMKNGRLYEGDSLREIWPLQRALPRAWFATDGPPHPQAE
ncbi:MAG TPA: amidohydrolase family protein [Steroidobacteraceae bacterium]|nr:amidohydrolase family protein [Steroidobacteraceae bacterium]